jgi:hypothetical protein
MGVDDDRSTKMRCWNCGKSVPETAKVCQFCEAAREPDPTEEEKRLVGDLLERMPPGAMEELQAAFEQSETTEDFANRILVGECPQCGSTETGNCENDPEIGEMLVGRCFQCGQLWCIECFSLLERTSPSCDCWDEE